MADPYRLVLTDDSWTDLRLLIGAGVVPARRHTPPCCPRPLMPRQVPPRQICRLSVPRIMATPSTLRLQGQRAPRSWVG